MTRRKFCQTTATLALATSVLGFSSLSPYLDMALAETVPTDELMKPEALSEMAIGNDKAESPLHFPRIPTRQSRRRGLHVGALRRQG